MGSRMLDGSVLLFVLRCQPGVLAQKHVTQVMQEDKFVKMDETSAAFSQLIVRLTLCSKKGILKEV